MTEKYKEFKKEEYKIELKIVAILSVDDIHELKKAIPALIKKRIENYNYNYLIQKKDSMDNRNKQAYLKCKISEFNEITPEEKHFMNTEVAQIRENWEKQFTEAQSNKIDAIYNRLENELEKAFNHSVYLKEEFLSTQHQFERQKEKELEK